MNFTDHQIEQLSAPLSTAHIVVPTGKYGPKGDYLEGWHVINEANRIFGFDGWSYTHELNQVSKMTNKNNNIEICYICKCRLVVGDIIREDIGYGSGASAKEGDAHEGAVKEAVTDALKRCLRTFGNPFGLALYDKGRGNVSAPMITDSQRDIIAGMAEPAGMTLQEICEAFKVKVLTEIPASKFAAIEKRLGDKIKQRKDNENGISE